MTNVRHVDPVFVRVNKAHLRLCRNRVRDDCATTLSRTAVLRMTYIEWLNCTDLIGPRMLSGERWPIVSLAPLRDSVAQVSVACSRQDRQLSKKYEPRTAAIKLPCDADVAISNVGK
ncbi:MULTISPECIES: hypothetical protein [Burkholderia]|uniref:hypothetical protein n=1 Tax=Burkholderia TaxID=32008 RepID=UPI0013CEF14E|nr:MULTISPECIES: hypothetical protein [Burkholderia]